MHRVYGKLKQVGHIIENPILNALAMATCSRIAIIGTRAIPAPRSLRMVPKVTVSYVRFVVFVFVVLYSYLSVIIKDPL